MVVRAEGFGEDILHAGSHQDRPDSAAGDDTGSRAGGTQENPAAIVLADHLMRNGVAIHLDRDQILARPLGPLADRFRHLVGFTVADSDLALLVTRYDERRKTETTAALHNLGATVDVNHLVGEFLVNGFGWGSLMGEMSHG